MLLGKALPVRQLATGVELLPLLAVTRHIGREGELPLLHVYVLRLVKPVREVCNTLRLSVHMHVFRGGSGDGVSRIFELIV